jgi:predicted type IV restriction endonuclease
MTEYTWTQMLGMANIYSSDSDIERDFKFDTWINRRKYLIITARDYAQKRVYAIDDGIEVLIIKE